MIVVRCYVTRRGRFIMDGRRMEERKKYCV